MDKKLYLKIIFIPIVIILLTVSSLTVYNIISSINYKDKTMEKETTDFIEKKKQVVYKKVQQTIINIEYMRKRNINNLKSSMKQRVDTFLNILNTNYKFHKTLQSKEKMKAELLNLIRNQKRKDGSNQFFVLDIDTGKALLHDNPKLNGKVVKDIKDARGTNPFKSKVDILKTQDSSYQELYFYKKNQPGIEFKKIAYFTKFKQLNWIIGTGSYSDKHIENAKKKIYEKLNTIQNDLKNYIFISKINNINGGKDFATVLVMPNKPALIGTKISDDAKDIRGNYHRKDYLKGIREEGEVFTSYWYKKPNTNTDGKKLTYFYHYKPWNWIIGSGFYFDDLENEIKHKEEMIKLEIENKLQNAIIVGIIFLIVAMLTSYYFAKNLTLRIKEYVDKIDKQNKLLLQQKLEVQKKDSILIQQSKMASMGEMIGNIAHQWRQPLNALSLTLQKIQMFQEEDILTKEKLIESVEKSKKLIQKMSTTIDDFRNFFKTDKVKEEFKIIESIDTIVNLLDGSLKNHNISLDISKVDKDIKLLGYKNELEQVILNIVNNSKDALIDKDISTKNIKIISYKKDNDIYIEIKDNAGGIPNNIINKIFEPYFTTKEQGKGTGIGLYMSKMIIETNMVGKLNVENDSNGAVFTIVLDKGE